MRLQWLGSYSHLCNWSMAWLQFEVVSDSRACSPLCYIASRKSQMQATVGPWDTTAAEQSSVGKRTVWWCMLERLLFWNVADIIGIRGKASSISLRNENRIPKKRERCLKRRNALAWWEFMNENWCARNPSGYFKGAP